MSNINNHNSGLTINVYHAPSRADLPPQKPGALTILQDDQDAFDDGESEGERGSRSAINKLPLPGWAKSFLKSMLGNTLPSSSDAAKSLREFQKASGIDLLSSEDVQEMADTGYRKMPDGGRKFVPRHIQAAAKKMMENNGKLFKKMQTAIRREEYGWLCASDYDAILKDGSMAGTDELPMQQGLDIQSFLLNVMKGTISHNRPTDYLAARTVQDFQHENNIPLIGIEQARQIADTGYCTMPGGTEQVPQYVQEAFMTMMEKNCQLFKKLETAIRMPADSLRSEEDLPPVAREGKSGLLAMG